jgi:hypothetical protein
LKNLATTAHLEGGLEAWKHVGATGLIKPAGQTTTSVSTAVHWTHMGTYLSGGKLAGTNLRCARDGVGYDWDMKRHSMQEGQRLRPEKVDRNISTGEGLEA